MIGLDSYSRQVFIYLDPILIYISLWIDCLFEICKIAVFPLAFVAGWLQGHWWGFISRNYVVWPTFHLMNVFIALKGTHFWFLFLEVWAQWVKSKFNFACDALHSYLSEGQKNEIHFLNEILQKLHIKCTDNWRKHAYMRVSMGFTD